MKSLATSYPGIESAAWLLYAIYAIPNVPTAVGFMAMWYFGHRLWPLTFLLGLLSICLGVVVGTMLRFGDFSLWSLLHPAVVTVGLGLCLCMASLKARNKHAEEDRIP